MAKVSISDRQRYALYLILNPMQHANRSERKRIDKLWDDIALDEIALRCDKPVSHLDFNNTETEREISSEQRDLIIDIVARPGINTAIGRLLNPVETSLLKAREGDG